MIAVTTTVDALLSGPLYILMLQIYPYLCSYVASDSLVMVWCPNDNEILNLCSPSNKSYLKKNDNDTRTYCNTDYLCMWVCIILYYVGIFHKNLNWKRQWQIISKPHRMLIQREEISNSLSFSCLVIHLIMMRWWPLATSQYKEHVQKIKMIQIILICLFFLPCEMMNVSVCANGLLLFCSQGKR